ncbi:MAG: restriction endonuclease subunit S [Spirochaetaceae bacterium]|jgi:type I restriction enzyme S subunit|nr:restriction endonuclease subunit S [Spirochaetaceae bacterium]
MKEKSVETLPLGWKFVRLGEVCEIIAGQSPDSSTYNTEHNGLPFYQGKADFGLVSPVPRVWCSEPLRIAIKGDILLSVRAPVGPTNMANENCCIGRGLCAIRADNINVDRGYLIAFFKHYETKITEMGSGSTFQAITIEDVKNIPIPLPPLAEQKRIAGIIQTKFEAIRNLNTLLKTQLAFTSALSPSFLRQAFMGEF